MDSQRYYVCPYYRACSILSLNLSIFSKDKCLSGLISLPFMPLCDRWLMPYSLAHQLPGLVFAFSFSFLFSLLCFHFLKKDMSMCFRDTNTFVSSWNSVWVSCSCCSKLPQTRRPKSTGIHSVLSGEQKSEISTFCWKWRCQQEVVAGGS